MEGDWIVDYFRRIFHCDPRNLPVETILHNHLLNLKQTTMFKECYQSLGVNLTVKDCTDLLEPVCGHTTYHAQRRHCHLVIHAASKLRSRLPRPNRDVHTHSDPNMARWQMSVNDTEIYSTDLHNLLGEDATELSHAVYRSFSRFMGHQMCLAEIQKQIAPCVPYAEQVCSNKLIEIAQIERLNAENLKLILRDYPHTHIIFHIRDPRGIAVARTQLYGNRSTRFLVEEARSICTQMVADYWEMVKLQKRYQHTSFILVKYEDMVMYPYEIAMETYNHIGLNVPDSYKRRVESDMLMNKAELMLGSVNSTLWDIYEWQKVLTNRDIKEINKHCRDALSVFQYSL